MKRLKSDLLVELVRTDSEAITVARQFWTSALLEQPRDFTTRERLIRSEQAHGEPAAVWELLEDCFELLEVEGAHRLEKSGFDTEQCLMAAKYLPQYLLFRERMPISDYWNTDDPLYDLPFAPPENREIKPALLSLLAVPFGVAFDAFEKSTGNRHSIEELGHLKKILGPLVERAFAHAAPHFAASVPKRESGADAVADTVTNMLLFLGLAAMREFSRQFGWIPSQFRVPRNVVDAAIDGSFVHEIQGTVMSASFVAIAEASGAFLSSDRENK